MKKSYYVSGTVVYDVSDGRPVLLNDVAKSGACYYYIAAQRGYVSRRLDDPSFGVLHYSRRKKLYYVLFPRRDTTQYCYRYYYQPCDLRIGDDIDININ